MKIVCWNVNGIRAGYRKGLKNFLEIESPDIFCVQETKAHIDQLSEDQVNPFGWYSVWSSAERKGYSGVATFSKQPAASVEYGIDIEKFDREGRFIITEHDDFTIFNIYFPNGARGGDRHDYKQEFNATLSEILKERVANGESIIVLGDYNVAPKPIDVYDPEKLAQTSGFLPEERAWFQEFLDIGFVDTFRHFYPDAKERYTWWNQITRARIGNRGWRIDHICVTQDLIGRVKRADILDDVEGSDHCPVLIEVD